MDYLALRKQVEERKLLNKTPGYYVRVSALLVLFFAAGWTVFYLFENFYVRSLIVLALGFICVQFGFLGHDAGHKAVSRKEAVNSTIGYITMTFINGVTWSYWSKNHNAHHKDPNHPEDPDANYLFAAFNDEQVRQKNKVAQWLIKKQTYFFIPMHLLTAFSMLVNSTIHSIRSSRGWRLFSETGLIALHLTLWIVIPGIFIGFGYAALFYAIATLIRGLYFAMVFVPNHVGRPMFKPEHKLSFIEKQIITARNITPSWFNDFFFGGLNYQIEHHLFPNTPRKNLRPCREIVKNYCAQHNLPYEEVGFFKCYKDVLSHVNKISKTI